MGFGYKIHCGSKNSHYVDSDDLLKAYYSEIKKYRILTEEEENNLVLTYRNAETDEERNKAREKLIKSNLRFVVSIAKKFGTNDTFIDLINEGNIGLIKAIEKFDPHKKCRLISYAVSWIFAYIQNYQITQHKSVVPHNAQKLHNYVKNVTREFFLKNERDPTAQEIADIIREKFNFNISNLEDVEMGRIVSIEEKFNVSKANDTFEDSTIYVSRTSSNNTDSHIDDEHRKAQVDFFLGRLSERERFIVERTYGIGCEQESFDTIGIHLNICGERVRQICNYAVNKLKDWNKRHSSYGK